MKKLKWLAIALIAMLRCVPAFGQAQPPVTYQPQLISFNGVPFGPCDIYQVALNTTNGNYYTCNPSTRTWTAASSGGHSSGTPIQKGDGTGGFANSGLSESGGTLSIAEDIAAKGLNPGIDIRAYGATFSPISPTTCTTTATVAAITTAANAPANGHGIMCVGAGPATSLSTPAAPTVFAGIAYGQMMTGAVTAGNTGSTTYAYKIVAEDYNGGLTAASTATSISNGNASLGTQSVNISSWSRSNATLTVTTASAHGLIQFAMAEINGDTGIGNPFYCNVATVPDNTHFTCTSNLDTRNGAAASGGSSGTVTWRNANHISMTNVANVFRYWIYGNNCPSTCNLIGVTLPVATQAFDLNDPLNNTWDDFGFGTTNAPPHPSWVPTTAPASATKQNLITTVASGGGTTGPTLTVAPSTSVSGATFQECADPAFLAVDAVLATGGTNQGHGVVPITPASTNFATCGAFTLGTSSRTSTWLIQGALALGDTLICNKCDLNGDPVNPLASFSFDRRSFVQVTSTTAPLLVWTSFQSSLQKLSLSIPGNGTGWLDDGAGSSIAGFTAEWLNFGSQSATDQLARHWVIRTNINMGANQWASHIFFAPGATANTNTPVFIETGDGGPWFTSDWFTAKRGFYWGDGIQGEGHEVYCQGCVTPKFTFGYNPSYGGGSSAVYFSLTNSIEDTTNSPIFMVLNALVSGVLKVNGSNGLSGYPLLLGQGNNVVFKTEGITSTSMGASFGAAASEHSAMPANCIEGVQSTAVTTCPQKQQNEGLNIGPGYSAFVSSLPQAAPTCSVSAGGSVPVGSYTFKTGPVFASGGEGTLSAQSTTCTTTTGNQTITINWATVSAATGYDLYENGFSFQCNAPWVGAVTSYIWSAATPCGQSAPVFAGSGPTAITRLGIFTPALTAPTITTSNIVFTPSAPIIWAGPNGSCGSPPSSGTSAFCISSSTTNGITASYNGDAYTQVTRGAAVGGTSSGVFNFANYGAVDDDSTDNCANGAVAAFNTAINSATSTGLVQAIIPAGTNNKAYKFATAANSCAIQLTNTKGIYLTIQGTLDCAQTATACIQVGATGQSSLQATEKYVVQGGTFWGGANLTKAGIYVEPGVNEFTILGSTFLGPQGGTTNGGFGGNANVSTGACANYSIYIDTPVNLGYVSNVYDGVSSSTSTSGSCGIANPGGAAAGVNTIFYTNNTIASTGFAGGSGACGSIGLLDGGSYGTGTNNIIYGFGVPYQIVGIGHTAMGNEIDAAQCVTNSVSAAFQIGQSGGSGVVGFTSIIGNKMQGGASHTTNLVALAGGTSNTATGLLIEGNQNILPSGLFTAEYLVPIAGLTCTADSASGRPCQAYGNIGFYQAAQDGWTPDAPGELFRACSPANCSSSTANLGAITIYTPNTNFAAGVQLMCNLYVTTQATTSSTVPSCVIAWTDANTNASSSITLAPLSTGGTNPAVGAYGTASPMIQPKAGTAITLATTGYVSSGATAMAYFPTLRAVLQ